MSFHDLAFEFLWNRDGLPLPIGDGFDGDPYLRKEDFTELALLVVRHVPGTTVKEFMQASEDARQIYLVAVRQALSISNAPEENPIENGDKVEPENVPDEFREGGKPDGEILTTPYLIANADWPFEHKKKLSIAYNEGMLTRMIKVGRAFAYLYSELSAMYRDDSLQTCEEEEEGK